MKQACYTGGDMPAYFVYYASINIVGAIIFSILLIHDYSRVDRQEKQVKYDRALVAFLLYFISDAIWSGVDSSFFPVNKYTVLSTNFSNFFMMTLITYTWLCYVMAEEHIKNRNSLLVKHILVMPLTISIIVLIVAYIISPGLLIDSEYKTTKAFDLFLVIVPFFYIIAVIIYGIKMAANEKNPMEKGRHLYIGLFPLIAVAGGFLQMMLMPELPVFCFSSTILMMVFYIHSMESQISTDPLTKLNNRGQLLRYVSQESSLWMEGRSTYVVMIDINDFKKINDTYGHWEGDSALILLSSAITNVIRKRSIPIFLARYGGDEFILIVHPADENELNTLIENIRLSIIEKCEKENKPYRMQVGIGLDKLNKEEQDAFSKALKRADDKMYENKKSLKK